MDLHAFTGIRYTGEAEAVGHHAVPPYDQIGPQQRTILHRDAVGFAHLTRPVPTATLAAHQRAAQTHRGWLERGTCQRESRPALYLYTIDLATGGSRLGLCGMVGLEEDTSPVIRPHEATVAKTVEERLGLLAETRLDLEPILLLVDDDGGLNEMLEVDRHHCPALAVHRDTGGNRHILQLLANPDRIREYRHLVGPAHGIIADGHHRYTVAQRWARREEVQAGTLATCKLAVLTSIASPGLQIDPIHRFLPAFEGDLDSPPGVSRQSLHDRDGRSLAASAASAPQPSFVVRTGAGRSELWTFNASRGESLPPDHLRHLAVGWLHNVVLPHWRLSAEAATDGTVKYRSDPDRLYSDLSRASSGVGIWLPPMTPRDFAQGVAGGSLMPPKSTRFLPKVVSGLVWAPHDGDID